MLDILVGHPQLFTCHLMSWLLQGFPRSLDLDAGYHGFVGALAMPLNLQNIQVEASRVWYIQCIVMI